MSARIAELDATLVVHALEEFGLDELVAAGMGRPEAQLEVMARACQACPQQPRDPQLVRVLGGNQRSQPVLLHTSKHHRHLCRVAAPVLVKRLPATTTKTRLTASHLPLTDPDRVRYSNLCPALQKLYATYPQRLVSVPRE